MYYEVEGTQVRLLGSIHLFPATSPEMPAWVTDAYTWCDEIVFETDASSGRQSLMLPNGETLDSRIQSTLFNELRAIWPTDGSFPALAMLKPCGVFLLLPQLQMKYVPGVDAVLRDRADKQGKKSYRLEGATELSGILDSIPDSIYINHIEFTLANPETNRRSFLDLHSTWLTRDPAAIFSAAARAPLWNSPLRRPLIEERNRMWAETIMRAWPSRRTLIVVGALHLAGESSLLTLLREQGLKISELRDIA